MTSKMTINKYQGKTKEEAIEKAKQELGEGAVVMNVKEIKPTGMFKAWKSSVFEVTAAREEKESFVDPRQVADLTAKTVKTLNLAADENISPKEFSNDRTSDILSGHLTNVPELHAKDGLEKRLENLSNILEKQLSVEESRQKEVKEEEKERQVVNPEGLQFIKMLYRTLLENEVNEKYVNQILDEAEKVMHSGSSVDAILSNVYQKMILKLGQPDTICVSGKKPRIIFFVGPTGVGKTTTIGKLAGKLRSQNKKVVLAAADTFRAAAGEQLKEWANRAQAELIGGQEGSDPAAVVYDAVAAAKARHADVLLIDTAGRLHNKKNLMEELRKMNKIIDREFPDAYRETLVVLDATTGQNALAQAKEFNEVADITGVILTKMDGTAKGGIAVAIQAELGIPVKYIGVGETIDDLQKFNSDTFVNALFDVKGEHEVC